MIAKFPAHSKSILFSHLKIVRNLNYTSNAIKHYYYYIIFLCQTLMCFWHKNKTEFLVQLTYFKNYENFVNHRHLTSLSLNLYTTYYELIYIIHNIHIRFIIKKIFIYFIHTLEGTRNCSGLVNIDNNCIFLSWTS